MIAFAAMRPVGVIDALLRLSRSSAISGLDQAHRQHDAQRHDDYVIQIPSTGMKSGIRSIGEIVQPATSSAISLAYHGVRLSRAASHSKYRALMLWPNGSQPNHGAFFQ